MVIPLYASGCCCIEPKLINRQQLPFNNRRRGDFSGQTPDPVKKRGKTEGEQGAAVLPLPLISSGLSTTRGRALV